MRDKPKEEFIDAGDAESEQYQAGEEVTEEFAEAQRLAVTRVERSRFRQNKPLARDACSVQAPRLPDGQVLLR